MNSMVGCYDLFDKFRDYIDNLYKDQLKLKRETHIERYLACFIQLQNENLDLNRGKRNTLG